MARRTYVTQLDPAGEDRMKGAPRTLTKQEFSKRLYQLMVGKGWTQSELGRRADLSRDSISTYMTGRNFPSPKNLQKLAEALGVESDDILPNYNLSALERDAPELEMKVSPSDPSTAYLRIARRVSVTTALKVLELINNDHLPDEDTDAG